MFLKNSNIISKIKRSKVTDCAALISEMFVSMLGGFFKIIFLKTCVPFVTRERINGSVVCQGRTN